MEFKNLKAKELFLAPFQVQHEATMEIVNTMLNYLLSNVYLSKLNKDNGEHPQDILSHLKQMWIADFDDLMHHFYEVYDLINDSQSKNN
jgi:hypothetical protein